jgi:hypothetical protein
MTDHIEAKSVKREAKFRVKISHMFWIFTLLRFAQPFLENKNDLKKSTNNFQSPADSLSSDSPTSATPATPLINSTAATLTEGIQLL